MRILLFLCVLCLLLTITNGQLGGLLRAGIGLSLLDSFFGGDGGGGGGGFFNGGGGGGREDTFERVNLIIPDDSERFSGFDRGFSDFDQQTGFNNFGSNNFGFFEDDFF